MLLSAGWLQTLWHITMKIIECVLCVSAATTCAHSLVHTCRVHLLTRACVSLRALTCIRACMCSSVGQRLVPLQSTMLWWMLMWTDAGVSPEGGNTASKREGGRVCICVCWGGGFIPLILSLLHRAGAWKRHWTAQWINKSLSSHLLPSLPAWSLAQEHLKAF